MEWHQIILSLFLSIRCTLAIDEWQCWVVQQLSAESLGVSSRLVEDQEFETSEPTLAVVLELELPGRGGRVHRNQVVVQLDHWLCVP